MFLPGYVLRDDQKSRIMHLKANGEPRWRIARLMGIPLESVRDVIRLHAPSRDPDTREILSTCSHVPATDVSEAEVTERRRAIRDGWSPEERANRRAMGASILRVLTGAVPS